MRTELQHLEAEFRYGSSGLKLGVQTVIRGRKLRAKVFNRDLFADPAWDILLELYACELAMQRICVSSLGYAVEVPQTTVLRWLKVLEQEGLVVRTSDPVDGRRIWMTLSPAGSQKMAAYFASFE